MALDIRGLFNPTSVSIPTSHLAEIMDGGEEPTDSFTVTKNLSHCAISNEVVGEASYYAEIAPTGGWSDLQVTIKVGGVDMSEYYSSGVINIPNVTGNIVITATAAAAPLVSITATYTQSGTVYDTDSLDSLKADLVVTANYDNGTSETVTTYTLSGTLAEGTSTITVSYGGKTTTFNVTVSVRTATPLFDSMTWTSFGPTNYGTISYSNGLDVTISSNTNTTNYNLGISSNGPANASKTYAQLKGHLIRIAYTANWTSIVEGAKLAVSVSFSASTTYNGTRKKAITFNIETTDTEGHFDFVVPTSDWTGWGQPGTVIDTDYFTSRNYFLSSASGATCAFTLRWYDMGVA